MSDTTHEAPERIWVEPDGGGLLIHNNAPNLNALIATGYLTKYVRSDLVQAAVAAKLREAADIAMRYHADALEWAKKVRGLEDHIGETDTFRVAQDILALIPEGAHAALDRVVAAERERGFWAGRSCGGSKAEIDAALAAIREGGE